MKNHTPPRMLGRVGDEQWERWQAAASRLGLTFTSFAKLCLDMHSQVITTEAQPRRKLPRKVKRANPKVKTMKPRKGMVEIEVVATFAAVLLFVVVVVAIGAWIVPTYNVWAAGKAGEATLMRAEQEKQIQIEQAKAELESAKLRAQAIETIGEMAKKYPEYREQEFIAAFGEAIQSGEIDQIIYVPTEANIPITEAKRAGRGEQ